MSTLERLSCLALKAESQRRMENEPVLVRSRISIGTFSDQYGFIYRYMEAWVELYRMEKKAI